MFNPVNAFSGFSVNNLDETEAFYGKTLGLEVKKEGVGLRIQLPGGGSAFTYPKPDHQPATFTILDFVVDNIDEAIDELTQRNVQFEHYDMTFGDATVDDRGIMRGLAHDMGPDIAWFKDPAGNIIAVLQEAK